jgi:hypothetical protein
MREPLAGFCFRIRPSLSNAPQIAQWLRESPNISSSEILQCLRLAGYRGGKSALYELVRRLRVRRSVNRGESC